MQAQRLPKFFYPTLISGMTHVSNFTISSLSIGSCTRHWRTLGCTHKFTLIHELTHIWLGESGISDADPRSQRQVERLCNAVAAEFLAPEDEFNAHWQADTNDWKVNLPDLSSHFHVSQWVIARRALEMGLITDGEYWLYVSKLQADYKAREKSGDPTYNRIQTGKVSKRLAQAVASEALSGRMLLRDAWQLIGIKPDKLAVYARKELGI